jgi:phosphoribosylanthranilate isomerase
MRLRVKICCMASVDEAGMAAAAGADLVGMVGPMPSGAGVIDLGRRAASPRGRPPGSRPCC